MLRVTHMHAQLIAIGAFTGAIINAAQDTNAVGIRGQIQSEYCRERVRRGRRLMTFCCPRIEGGLWRMCNPRARRTSRSMRPEYGSRG